MKRMKKRIFAGVSCDQIVYTVPEQSGGKKLPKPRFKDEAERAKHRKAIALRHCTRLVNENCTTGGYFATLTFDNEHECHEFEEARRERTNFRRRLLHKNPNATLFIFMGRGDSTSRIHLHIICDNVTPRQISAAWRAGKVVRISRLREHNRDRRTGEDWGADFTALVEYCFKHWTPEQGGHYYSSTRGLRQPEEEEPTVCHREYDAAHPPICPKGYKMVDYKDTPYGYQIWHYVKIPAKPSYRRPKAETAAPSYKS